jgi:hypothetical protein
MCLVLAALPAFGTDQQIEPSAILYTTFQQPPSTGVMQALMDEVETIMGPLGRHFAWRSTAGVKGNEISSELAVLTFKGKCDVSVPAQRTSHPGALGWTHVSDGAILPFAEIECDRIHSFLQRELLCLKPAEREDAFGRAVARVVAHELYHIFANTQHHGSEGVGKAAYSVEDLLLDEFDFEGRESRALRTSAAHPTERHTVGTP